MDINKKIKIFGKPLFKVKHILIAVTALLCLTSLVAIAYSAFAFLTVGDVSVSGVLSIYEGYEIEQKTGIRNKDFWYAVDEKEIEEKLLAELKYLDSVKVKKSFPNNIVIEVEEKVPRWYIDVQGVKYALDGDMVVIDEIKKTTGVTKLVLPEIKRVFSGELPLFSQDSEVTQRRTLEILSTVRESKLRRHLTVLDIDNREFIYLEFEKDGKRFKANLGDDKELERKLNDIYAYLDTDTVKGSEGGEFNAYTGIPVSFRPTL